PEEIHAEPVMPRRVDHDPADAGRVAVVHPDQRKSLRDCLVRRHSVRDHLRVRAYSVCRSSATDDRGDNYWFNERIFVTDKPWYVKRLGQLDSVVLDDRSFVHVVGEPVDDAGSTTEQGMREAAPEDRRPARRQASSLVDGVDGLR